MPPKQQVVAKKGQTDIFSFFNKPKVTEAAPSSSSISANKTLNQVNIESGDDKEHSSSTAISKSGDPPSGTSSQGSTLSSVAPQDKSQNLVEVTSSNQTVSDKAAVKKVRKSNFIVNDEEDELDEEIDNGKNEKNESNASKGDDIADSDDEEEKLVISSSAFFTASTSLSTVPPTLDTASKVLVSAKIEMASPTLKVSSPSNSKSTKEFDGLITWKVGQSIPYLALADTFEAVSKVGGRLDKESLLCRLFRAVIATTPLELDVIVHLASNSVAPAYEGMELGIGDSLLVKAVSAATGRKKESVEEDYKNEGDLGIVALNSRNSQKTISFAAKPKPLLAKEVLEALRQISKTKGEKAQGRKVEIIKGVMVRCQGSEAKYIVRALQGKLRIGTAEQTVLVALAHSFALTSLPHQVVKDEEKKATEAEDKRDEKVEVIDAADDAPVESSNSSSSSSSSKSLIQLIDEVEESEPLEALKLRKGESADLNGDGTINGSLKSKNSRLTKEGRCELAVIAVKRAFSQCPNLSLLINALLTLPLHQLYQSCRLIPGVPVAPMLAKPTKEVKEVLKRLSGQAFTMEYKYDGERAQVHLLPDGTVKIFSRNSEDNSEKYPDLKEVVKRARCEGMVSCVLDAEVVAYDREKKCLLSFQVLSTRKRKVEEGDVENQKVKVVLQLFDMLYVNGKSLLHQSLRQRREILKSSFKEEEGFLCFASGGDHVEDGDTAPIELMMGEACAAMCEGLMVKTLDANATYEPSRRSLNWLKLKKDYIDGMGVCDSVDLVVIGGYLGRGKRVNSYGAYLMACYDADKDEFQSVCKVGTGFKDEDLTRLTEKVTPTILGSNKRPLNYNVGDPLTPDHWFEASFVWELQAADLSMSNVHKGGIGRLADRNRGIGLRFPRFIREREDKKPEGCTASEQIVDMYISQGNDLDNNGNGKDEGDDDDDDDAL